MRRDGDVTPSQLKSALLRLGVLQIDSVNVLVRAHYMPHFSRLGKYDSRYLDALIGRQPQRFFEYWGHEASILPIELQPLLRWRMARARRGVGIWKQLERFAGESRPEADAMLRRIREEGPLSASSVSGSRAAKGMWVWSEAKHALEWLFWAGLVAAVGRRGNFERLYDLPERVLPKDVLDAPTPSGVDARRSLLSRAAKALGVATADDLRDYYRIPASDVREPLKQLVEDGTVIPVRVRGWRQQAYLQADASAGRRLEGAALLSPFDPLIFHRPRTERLFGFRYRLEIYTPAHKREHGYYVLPFLMDGAIVARVDLKADRKALSLIVQRLHVQAGAPTNWVERLLCELRLTASWLGMSRLMIAPEAAAGALLAILPGGREELDVVEPASSLFILKGGT
ncbi:winged helix-turn-helix domain-containing protein [Sphingomonas sp. AP4-R1]|nr:winged helix-turn-helix domain-containing protein [Sphingomonas sp. AP4-R1]